MDDLETPMIWVFTGDSITHGAKWVGSERSYPELIQEEIRWSLGRRRDFVINTGISGESTKGLLTDFDWRACHWNPHVVSIMIGMNDAVAGPAGREPFEANLREMVRRVHAMGSIPILHSTNSIDDAVPDCRTRHDLPAYNEVIIQVAHDTSTILVDHWSRWQEQRPLPHLHDWLGHAFHPNGAGHRAFAQEFFRTLGYDDYTPPSPSLSMSSPNGPIS
jgi:lysophospholipase L1-like esterase